MSTCMLPYACTQHACLDYIRTCNIHVWSNMHAQYCKHACYMYEVLTRDATILNDWPCKNPPCSHANFDQFLYINFVDKCFNIKHLIDATITCFVRLCKIREHGGLLQSQSQIFLANGTHAYIYVHTSIAFYHRLLCLVDHVCK